MSQIRMHVEIIYDPYLLTVGVINSPTTIPTPIIIVQPLIVDVISGSTTIPDPSIIWKPILTRVNATTTIPTPTFYLIRVQSDSASAHESTFLSELITSNDSGTGTDSQSTPAEPASNSDSGTATDNGTVVISSPAPLHPRWTFSTDTAEITFEINPSDTNEISRTKSVLYKNTLPSMKSLIYEGNGPEKTFSWTGTTLTQSQYEAFIEWYNKEEQVRLMDDLGRIYMIYITDLEPKRERSPLYPWKHSYRMQAVVLSEL